MKTIFGIVVTAMMFFSMPSTTFALTPCSGMPQDVVNEWMTLPLAAQQSFFSSYCVGSVGTTGSAGNTVVWARTQIKNPERSNQNMFERPEARSMPNRIVRSSTPGSTQTISGSTSPSGGITSDELMEPIIRFPQKRLNSSEFDFATKPWFALISGLASVLGLLAALYPVPARNLPPSEYKTLLWRKSLYFSFGVGVIVFSVIQLYQQQVPPSFPFGWFFNILHGIDPSLTRDYSGTLIWGILLVVGVIILLKVPDDRAQAVIRKRVIDEFAEIQRSEKKAIDVFLNGRDLSALSGEEKMEYQEIRWFHKLLRYSTIEMLTGSQFAQKLTDNSQYSLLHRDSPQ